MKSKTGKMNKPMGEQKRTQDVATIGSRIYTLANGAERFLHWEATPAKLAGFFQVGVTHILPNGAERFLHWGATPAELEGFSDGAIT